MKLEEMRAEIASHTDFKEEKTKLEHFLNNLGHACIMLPKFHCELKCRGQAKLYSKVYTNYTLPHLRSNISLALDSVTNENIIKSQKLYVWPSGGINCWAELEKLIKKYKKEYKSHRRVGVND